MLFQGRDFLRNQWAGACLEGTLVRNKTVSSFSGREVALSGKSVALKEHFLQLKYLYLLLAAYSLSFFP